MTKSSEIVIIENEKIKVKNRQFLFLSLLQIKIYNTGVSRCSTLDLKQ